MTAAHIAGHLDALLDRAAFPADDPNGLWHGDAGRAVQKLGVALEPPPDLAAWVSGRHLDALWLHRPWHADVAALPPGFPVLAHHLSFDERLTPGWSPVLADRFGLREVEVLGHKQGRPLGMLGRVVPESLAGWVVRLRADFGGYEALEGTASLVEKVAFVGAFWPELVQEAALRGVDLYVTGQLRNPGVEALRRCRMAALALGHARVERQALHRLTESLTHAFPGLEVVQIDAA